MHLLITNDDGVSSVGLKALADAAMRRGHRVFISAPNGQRSANSQHITLTAPIIVHQHAWEGAEAYAVDGTPSDCVRVAPFLANAPFDFCLSGINHGENAGPAVYYSGTVAAAREAALANRAESAKRRAKESVNYAHNQQRELAAALKAAQAAMEKVAQERDNALRLKRLAEERAEKETAARQTAERKIEALKRSRRLFGSSSRKNEENAQASTK